MGVLYAIGKTLVSRDELLEKAAVGHLRDFAEASAAGGTASILFTAGEVSTEDLPNNNPDALPFEPIGMNKPLTIEFASAYTGDAPGRSFFDRIGGRSKPDLLIVSGAKTPSTFDTAPRAINQLVKDIEDKKQYRPGAFRNGSSIIYHSPAITDATTHISVEMVADSFSGGLFELLESLFRKAAGLPVFAPAAAYLLAGSTIAAIGSKLANSLSETGAFMKGDETIRFDSGGWPIELARFLVFANDSDLHKLSSYSPHVSDEAGNARVTLVHTQSNEEYQGDVPYVIGNLDGRTRSDDVYNDFKPQHASAAMLEQFYGRNTLSGVTQVLNDAMTLYNDFRFLRSAERLKDQLKSIEEKSANLQEQLEGVDENAAEYKKLQERLLALKQESRKIEERLDAYKANILTDEFRDGL